MTRRYSRFCPFCRFEATSEHSYWTHRDGCTQRPGRHKEGDRG